MNTDLATFLSNIYLYTGLGILNTFFSSMIFSFYLPVTYLGLRTLMNYGVIMLLGTMFTFVSLTAIKYKSIATNEWRIALYYYLTVGIGMQLSLFSGIWNHLSPMMMLIGALLTILIYLSSTISIYFLSEYALYFQSDHARLTPLISGISTLLYMGLIAICSFYLVGPNLLTDLWFNIDFYLALVLLVSILVYQTNSAIIKYNQYNFDYLDCVVDLYLDGFNLMLSSLEETNALIHKIKAIIN